MNEYLPHTENEELYVELDIWLNLPMFKAKAAGREWQWQLCYKTLCLNSLGFIDIQ